MRKLNVYRLGACVGGILSLAVVLRNVIFWDMSSDSPELLRFVFCALFFVFGWGGYLASWPTRNWRKGALGGVVVALMVVGMVMITLIVIDNVFLDIVSRQPGTLTAYQDQTAFHSMRAFINYALWNSFLFVAPVLTALGAFFGMVGAWFDHRKGYRKY